MGQCKEKLFLHWCDWVLGASNYLWLSQAPDRKYRLFSSVTSHDCETFEDSPSSNTALLKYIREAKWSACISDGIIRRVCSHESDQNGRYKEKEVSLETITSTCFW